jgi:hypothetical protein
MCQLEEALEEAAMLADTRAYFAERSDKPEFAAELRLTAQTIRHLMLLRTPPQDVGTRGAGSPALTNRDITALSQAVEAKGDSILIAACTGDIQLKCG